MSIELGTGHQVSRDGCVQYLSHPPQTYAITISDATGKQLQKIVIRSSSPQNWLLSIIDMDGDGYKDLYLNLGYGAGPFPFTSVYRFNTESKQFEEDKTFPAGSTTPAEMPGCVYLEERMSVGDANYDYTITEWCRDPKTKEWKKGKSCSLENDKECFKKLDNYQKDWRKQHTVE